LAREEVTMSSLADFRKSKDDFFRRDAHSPLALSQKRAFKGLSYFDENPQLDLTLELEEFEAQETVELQTSTGDVERFTRWAGVAFQVDGTPARLALFKSEDGAIFLPFADATSGKETYGAGRYLEVELTPDGKLHLDFNYAYNPYCAYNDAWSCPLTPPENRLSVPIRAGERRFK
jgi:hypothetical protein